MFRNSPCHGASGYNGLRARNITFKKAVKRVMRDQSNNQFIVQMENMIRRVVREEFDRLIQPCLSLPRAQHELSRSEPQPSLSRVKLLFLNSPPSSIFTGSKIEVEDGSPVLIELVDAATNSRVVSGPHSSSKVEIVPLNADFTEESWTVEGFTRNILKQREARRPLLTGDTTLMLKDGVGVINVAFSDNSSWTRSGKFRLGARLAAGGAVEARSEAFVCKDQRGESYRKHYPPYPSSEVWRLEKIAKNGVWAKRLGEVGVKTVKDFRRLNATNPTILYNIFGVGISKRMSEAIISHAMTCVLDVTECYIYNANALDVSLVFNSVYELIKVIFNGGACRNADQLSSYQLEQLKLEAYRNTTSFIAVDGRNFGDHPQMSLPCPQDPGFGIACPGLQHINFQGSSNPSDSSMSLHLTASGPAVQPEMLMSFEKQPAATFHIDRRILSSRRNSFRVNEHDSIHDESRSVVAKGWNENEEEENTFSHHYHHDGPLNWSPGMTDWTQQTLESMVVSVTGTEEAGMFDVRFANLVGSPRARWCKVKAAFKLREVWRNAAARRNQGF
ncbi:hypothetical protein AALP_AA8G250300 [Arabis alpina]|uniref:Uncharacterized protein n=1 Tax=Arabis alpina TaxID=50452 RepID=A0A087G9A1_ARAAL|nr:hypothetical protein AALP_AA8G250300 [Arabis alpina]